MNEFTWLPFIWLLSCILHLGFTCCHGPTQSKPQCTKKSGNFSGLETAGFGFLSAEWLSNNILKIDPNISGFLKK